MRQEQPGESILCVRLSGLGDVVHALGALALLRRERPGAHITWVVEDRFAGLLEGHPHVDELLTVPRRRWGRMLRSPLRWGGLWRERGAFVRRLRGRRYETSVDFQSSLKSAWIVAAARARLRIGFGGPVSREFSHVVQNATVCPPRSGVHRIERDLALLGPLGIAPAYAEPALPASEADAAWADAALAGRGGRGPLVVIHPGTSASAAFKRWAPERYAEVADGLVERRAADVLVTCGPDERPLAERVTALMRRPSLGVPPTETLGQLIALLRRADLFIGSDTGPMHVASALGVPTVALFGPKDPGQTGPYWSRSVVVAGDAPCRPCTRRRCPRVRCMESIASDRVLEAALAVLDGAGECRASTLTGWRP